MAAAVALGGIFLQNRAGTDLPLQRLYQFFPPFAILVHLFISAINCEKKGKTHTNYRVMGKQRVAVALTPHQEGQPTVLTMSLWYPAAPRPPVERQSLFCAKVRRSG